MSIDEYGNEIGKIGFNFYDKFLQLWDIEHKYLLFNFQKDDSITLMLNYIDCFEEIQL
jgi:hypothetical protein